jgi:hypothetical protein
LDADTDANATMIAARKAQEDNDVCVGGQNLRREEWLEVVEMEEQSRAWQNGYISEDYLITM